MSTTAPTRLSRLLAMVPYFLARPGIKVATAAADLGVTQKQLTKDLEQLFVCGLPGYMPDDLIDIQFYDGYVTVGFTAGMDKPLRLTGTEANVLLIALRMLLDAGAVDADAVRRAMAKIEEAMGASHHSVIPVPGGADDADSAERRTLRDAVAADRALAIRYYTPSRDEVTDRVVDPIRIKAIDGQSYLEAWCRGSEGVRLFRFDRVYSARMLDEPSDPPTDAAAPVSFENGTSVLPGELPTVRVEIDPEALWLLEYYSAEADTELDGEPEGPVAATLRYGSPQWLERFLLGFGGRVRLLEPSDSAGVAESTRATAKAARARY
ncbi:helix-turn-helix transcriptional regulator [Gordonia zhaorongruii]|uniref:helix-turn-helix transcriptional regulator n=1 Tax=Gordonia zhaorongruii TaxID=2597659 RepID=UPI00104B380B|nr:WYL domain-containing protein [Gordonia zhaorongruii]